jgi:uncharacterized protein GlcG (DUF336 family)
MSNYTRHLTYEGARIALIAAVAKAEEIGVPQCITIADDGGHLLAFGRMDGGKIASITTSQTKALTAASHRMPTSKFAEKDELKLSLASRNKLTNLKGGVPIIIDGICVGSVGVGSGTGEQDLVVAQAALAALGADPMEV